MSGSSSNLEGLRARERRIVEQVADVARPEILKVWRRDSCIASTRVATLALQHFGIRAQPLPCRVKVSNDAYLERVTREGRLPQSLDEAALWWSESRAWSLGVGFRDHHKPGKWNGHVVALVGGELLLDLSIDQCSRPQRDILIDGAVLVPATRPFLAGDKRLYVASGNAHITYDASVDDRSFVRSPDWTRLERHRPVVKRIVAAIR